jgi:hypothetical protein
LVPRLGSTSEAANAKVLGQGNPGVGYGGTPVNVQNEKGEVLDFLATFKVQSKCNSQAARAAAVSAIAAATLFLLNMVPVAK